MSKIATSVFVLVVLLLVPAPALGQGEEEKTVPRPYIYATYFHCEPTGEWRADEIIETLHAPIYNAAVEEDTLAGWGWMAHHTGGKWRRLLYRVSTSIEGLLDAQEMTIKKVREKSQQASLELGRICNAHDDYIWQQVTGSSGDERGAAGFSMYLACDMAKEERADELVKTVFAPVYDKHVGEGKLVSWGWMSHVVGGKWRRLATMTAADHKTILAVRANIIEELGKNEAAMEEFSSICTSHQDYMWDIKMEVP
jgi:hypothetical protein